MLVGLLAHAVSDLQIQKKKQFRRLKKTKHINGYFKEVDVIKLRKIRITETKKET